jgi:hypothetical protein
VEREGLDEVGNGLEGERPGIGRVDAREQNRDPLGAEAVGDPQACRIARLDNRGVDADVIDVAADEYHRLVPETADNELEESADVGMWFADEDTCHGASIEQRRRD